MSETKATTVRLTVETKNRLERLANYKESIDDVVQRLLEAYYKEYPNERPAAVPHRPSVA